MEEKRRLLLSDGSEYSGFAFGADLGDARLCEVVFNTSMVGYQEILSDPSYTDQAVVMTYPLIGNYGICEEDFETAVPSVGAMIVREYCDRPSNFRCRHTLSETMRRYGIPGLSGVDTRKLTRRLRDGGTCMGLLLPSSVSTEEGWMILQNRSLPRDAVSRVSHRTMQCYGSESAAFHVVAVDCGMKQNIVRCLLEKGCRVTVVPYNTTGAEIRRLAPDGIFLSNGPGDPTDASEVIETVRELLGNYPMFGICLGHQMICLAYGAKTYKLKFGHRGGNHPVKSLRTGRVEITSQNHSYAVDEETLSATPLTVTHRNLLDGTVEGVECRRDRVFSVQYHPESAPGPQDSRYLFDRFLGMMEEAKEETNHAEKN